jgi:hypothetical protein
MGCAGVPWRDPRQGRPLRRSHRRRAHARGGAADLVFFLLLLEEHNPVGVGVLPPSLGFKDFHHPRQGGGRAELGPRLPHGLAARFFL